MNWLDWAKASLDRISQDGRLRRVRDLDPGGPVTRTPEGRSVVSFASNDYLGLTQHPKVKEAAREAIEHWGAGSGSARLIVGSRPVHSELERAIAEWKGTESALLFPTGFATNVGVLNALGTEDVLICSDELNHASIIDGCRSARAEVAVYPHKDLAALEAAIAATDKRVLVVTDSVFSMDGDVAPLDDLIELCGAHGAALMIDEAHAVLGPHPAVSDGPVLRVGTLSKFLGAMGGYVAGDAALTEVILNMARPFIFTTGSAPADAAAALAAIGIVRSPEGERLMERLRALIDMVRPGHPSPILPVVVGGEADAVAASRDLEERGYLVPAIRPPSVPKDSSRLRVTLSAAHTEEQVEGLLGALEDMGLGGAIG